jgi:hypothetical protein
MKVSFSYINQVLFLIEASLPGTGPMICDLSIHVGVERFCQSGETPKHGTRCYSHSITQHNHDDLISMG